VVIHTFHRSDNSVILPRSSLPKNYDLSPLNGICFSPTLAFSFCDVIKIIDPALSLRFVVMIAFLKNDGNVQSLR